MSKLELQLNRFLDSTPKLGRNVYLARGCVVIGDVTIGDKSSVWYNAVLRGDINFIRVGRHSNIQDNAVLHLADDDPCIVGDWVTIGHSAVVHACTVEDEVLIGMGAIVLDGARIGTQSIVGAGALVTQGFEAPPGSLLMGTPARIARTLTRKERLEVKKWAVKYVRNAAYCLRNRIGFADSPV